MSTVSTTSSLSHLARRGLALDIDDTLCRTYVTWIAALNERVGNPEGLTARQLYEKYTSIFRIPYWQEGEAGEILDSFRTSEEMHINVPLIEEALPYVQKIHKIIPVVAYLTARSELVTSATQRWLERQGFPQAEIISRPESVSYNDCHPWKARLLHELYPTVQGIVDDTMIIADHLPGEYEGTFFLLHHPHYSGESKRVVACPTWQDVYEQIVARFS